MSPFTRHLVLSLFCYRLIHSMDPICDILQSISESKASCARAYTDQSAEGNGTIAGSADCPWEWNTFICWPSAAIGEVVNRTCPSFLDPMFVRKR
ncbi:secretin receptor-like [Mustelus asterias]